MHSLLQVQNTPTDIGFKNSRLSNLQDILHPFTLIASYLSPIYLPLSIPPIFLSTKQEMISFAEFLQAGGMSSILKHAVAVKVDPTTSDPDNANESFVEVHILLHTAYKYPSGDSNTEVEKRPFAVFNSDCPNKEVTSPFDEQSFSTSIRPSTPLPDACDERSKEDGHALFSSVEEEHTLLETPVKQELTDNEHSVSNETQDFDESEAEDPFAECEFVKYSPRCDGNMEGCLPCGLQLSSPRHDDISINRVSTQSFHIDSESADEIQPDVEVVGERHANHICPNVDSRHGFLTDEVEVLEQSRLEQKEVGGIKRRRKGILRKAPEFTQGLVSRLFRRKEAKAGPGEQRKVRVFMLSGELGNVTAEEIIDSKGKVRRREERRDLPSRRYPDRR